MIISFRRYSFRLVAAPVLSVIFLLCGCPKSFRDPKVPAPPSPGSNYYLDCSTAQSGSGTEASPWNSVGSVNAFTFHARERLLLKRGSTCNGLLAPQGSGAPGAPIVIDAYGTGPAPIIDGGHAEAAVKLFNQQYWEINNLEIVGGDLYGLYVSGDTPNSTLTHIYLRHLDVHGAHFNSRTRSDSGEVFLSPKGARQTLHDVLIDHVTAHDSHVSEGIIVSAGGGWVEEHGVLQPLGSDVTVQDSTAHDVYGDGIMIAEVTNGMLQRNVVYRSGLCPDCTGSTPVGLWQWYCHKCVAQYNESYANESWGKDDGGDYDIDYFNEDNLVQYNYGHDSAGYCIAIYAAGSRATVNSIVRFNVCSNNGRSKELSKQGEIYIHTWDGGSIDGLQIYNNTIYWNPASNAAAINASDPKFSGNGPRFFRNNIIYSTVPEIIRTLASGLSFDNNIYWSTAASSTSWQVDANTYTSFSAYHAATRQDAHSDYVDPKLTEPSYHAPGMPKSALQLLPGSPAIGTGADICAGRKECSMGSNDFWKHALAGRPYNIGANQQP
jgi:hypothetical protein